VRLKSAAIRSRATGAVVEGLPAMFGFGLRRWRYSKLETGKAIEVLLRSGGLASSVESEGRLKPAVYYRIEDLLQSGVAWLYEQGRPRDEVTSSKGWRQTLWHLRGLANLWNVRGRLEGDRKLCLGPAFRPAVRERLQISCKYAHPNW